jgi:tetratricopeptide (TPR) repeat protein
MRLSDSSGIDADVAREIAQRQGYRAVVAGRVAPLGAGYQLTAQIIEPATGEVAVRLRETAADDGEVLDAVERLVRLARRHLGESLRSLRRSQPLPEVTTQSLEALQLHARGVDLGRRGELFQAIALLRQAVERDTAFAAAYRALGIYYGNLGNLGAAQANIDRAYRHSERLTPRERYLIGSVYHSYRGRLDSAAHYYALLVDRYPFGSTALNNLGDVYERMGRYEDAFAMYRRAVDAGQGIVTLLNLASAARTLGRHTVADSMLARMGEQFPNTWMTWQTSAGNVLYAGDFDRLQAIATEMANSQYPFPRAYGRWIQASLSAMRGQISRALALTDTATVLAAEAGSQVFEYRPLLLAEYAALASGDPQRAVPLLQKARDPAVIETAPVFQHLLLASIANGYALAGDWESTNRLLASMDSLTVAEDFHAYGAGDHVRAVMALAQGRPEESLEYLNRARTADYGLQYHSGRLLLADTYAALGRWSEAAVQYDTVTGTFGLNFNEIGVYGPLRPLAHERAATAYLALGDTATAIEHLATFAELWEQADPELQPIVSQARDRLAELVGEPRSAR